MLKCKKIANNNWSGIKLELLNLQIALFFTEIQMRPDILLNNINNQFPGYFDKDIPTMIPVPPNAPADIPVISLNNTEKYLTLNISRSRIDLIVDTYQIYEALGYEKTLESYKDLLLNFSKQVFNLIDISRTGIICRSFLKDENPENNILNNYTKIQDNSISEITIRTNTLETRSKVSINNVTEISSTNREIKNKNIIDRGVVIMKDINNVIQNYKLLFSQFESVYKFAFFEFGESKIRGLL